MQDNTLRMKRSQNKDPFESDFGRHIFREHPALWVLPYKWGLLLRILSSSLSGDHPKNNLAKFGCILDMKVGKKNPFLATYIYQKIWRIWDFFFMKNPFS
jgi:hypothetical protein